MRKILPFVIASFTLLFTACQKENTAPLPETVTEDSSDRTALDLRVSRIGTFFSQTIGSLTLGSTASVYTNSSAVSCPQSTVNGDVLNMEFGQGVENPCDIGNGTFIGGDVDLYRGSTGDLLNTCPGPYSKGSLVFDNLFVAGCYVNVDNQGDWDNLVFYAKDDCDDDARQPGQLVEFDFLTSQSYNLQFTDGNNLNFIDPINSTSGPMMQIRTTVPDADLFSFETLYNLEYKIHIPFINNSAGNNYYTTLTMFDLPTFQEETQVGLYTAPHDRLCYRPFASRFITQGTLFTQNLQDDNAVRSVTTYDFGSDANGDDLGENDPFVKVCFNEKVGDDIVLVCKVVECFSL